MEKRHFNEAERLIYKQGGQRSHAKLQQLERRGTVHVVYSKLLSLSIVHVHVIGSRRERRGPRFSVCSHEFI